MLLANDGSVYLLRELSEYIESKTEEQLEKSITFSTHYRTTVTLKELKSKEVFYNYLAHPTVSFSALFALNSSLFTDSYPALSTVDEIYDAKNHFNNEKFHQVLSKLNTDAIATLEFNTIANLTEFRYVTLLHKDLIKLTLKAERQLKQHLENELTNCAKESEQAQLLSAWREELTKNIEKNEAYFKYLVPALKKIIQVMQQAQLKHLQLTKNSHTKDVASAKIQLKVLEQQREQLHLENKEKVKNSARWHLILGIGFIVFTLLSSILTLTLVTILAPEALFITAAVMAAIALVFKLYVLFDPSNGIGIYISNALDRPEQEAQQSLNELNGQIKALNEDILFINSFTECNKYFVPSFGNPEILIHELEMENEEFQLEHRASASATTPAQVLASQGTFAIPPQSEVGRAPGPTFPCGESPRI